MTIYGYPIMNSVVNDKLPHLLNFANTYVKGCELEEENRVLKHQLRLQMDANRRKKSKLRGLRVDKNYHRRIAKLDWLSRHPLCPN
jgi:hypothetical protein